MMCSQRPQTHQVHGRRAVTSDHPTPTTLEVEVCGGGGARRRRTPSDPTWAYLQAGGGSGWFATASYATSLGSLALGGRRVPQELKRSALEPQITAVIDCGGGFH